MNIQDAASRTRVTVVSSFVLESARLCILEVALRSFGSLQSLAFRCNTEHVEVSAAEVLPRSRAHASDKVEETRAIIALRWRGRPPMVRLLCRSERISAAIAISNFETTSLAHFVASADADRLIALVNVLRGAGPEFVSAHSHVAERIRKLGRREFFLNWLPATEDRFVCLVLQATIDDPAALRLTSLDSGADLPESLLPVSHSIIDGYVMLVYDLKNVVDRDSPVEIAAVIQGRLHYWRLEPRLLASRSTQTDSEHLIKLSSRWTERVCEAIAAARSDLLIYGRWEVPELDSAVARSQSVADASILVVTDVVDMFGLILVMAATHIWREVFGRIFLLLPAAKGDYTVAPPVEPLALMHDFGGSGLIEPITTDELISILHSDQPAASLSFTSAAAPYNTHVEAGGEIGFPIATFDISSPERLRFVKKLVHYCVLAGGPLVWRELQCAFSNKASEGLASALLSEGQGASLVDDLYAAPCTKLGWPLCAFQHFDRQMLSAFRSGELE